MSSHDSRPRRRRRPRPRKDAATPRDTEPPAPRTNTVRPFETLGRKRLLEDEDSLPDEAFARTAATSIRKRSRDDEDENDYYADTPIRPFAHSPTR